MILKEWIKLVDPIVDVVIWTQDDKDEPAFEGSVLDIPWWLADCEIGRADSFDCDEPIYISTHTNRFNHELPVIVINCLVKDYIITMDTEEEENEKKELIQFSYI